MCIIFRVIVLYTGQEWSRLKKKKKIKNMSCQNVNDKYLIQIIIIVYIL